MQERESDGILTLGSIIHWQPSPLLDKVMGFGDFWNKSGSSQSRIDAALEFIRTGNIRATFNNETTGSPAVPVFDAGGGVSNINKCRNSGDCASGWWCVSGLCTNPSSSGSPNGNNVNGNSGQDCGSGLGDPGGGSGGCGGDVGVATKFYQATGCNQPRCGNEGRGGNPLGVCCGERCCRIGNGFVQCFCGKCPPPGRCQKYCDSFFKSNGRQAEGCDDATKCTECESCTESGGTATCVPIRSGGPCYCGEGNGCSQCSNCKEDGTCEYDCANCKTCTTIFNYPCSCGDFTIKCCASTCNENAFDTNSCIAEGCEQACGEPEPPDPCAPECDTITETGQPGGSAPTCPSDYRQVGSITALHDDGDVTVVICQKCKLPPECEPADCNCHLDCPDCQLCSYGACAPDPACSP